MASYTSKQQTRAVSEKRPVEIRSAVTCSSIRAAVMSFPELLRSGWGKWLSWLPGNGDRIPISDRVMVHLPQNIASTRSTFCNGFHFDTDRFLSDTAPIRCLPFDRIAVRHPGIGASADLPTGLKKGWEFAFLIRYSVCRVVNDSRCTPGVSLISAGGPTTEMGHTQWTWLQHRAPCRDAGPQYDQKENNKLGLYPAENGLSK
jgi:hypothetical protein